MRNYDLMRAILCKVANSEKAPAVRDFRGFGEIEDIRQELERLKNEGLIVHDIKWEAPEISYGKVTSITQEGKNFLRNIENEHVWALICKTLEDANLDLAYPLLKEVCDEIVKRYVMSKIPKEL